MSITDDIAIVGGCGHVGLPLGLAFADMGERVVLYDIDERSVELVNDGTLPFMEPGAAPVLHRALHNRCLRATSDPSVLAGVETVVVVIGTPIDEHLNPDLDAVPRSVAALAPHLRDGQLLVLRSTVYPGVTELVERVLRESGRRVDVAFCPERIAEGKALVELYELPQIVAARTEDAFDRAAKLFRALTAEIVQLQPEEAELAKLFTNTWRYVKFATANQFYMIANDFGLDFERIRSALTWKYERAADMPGAGFAAGPCLLKDTMQLGALHNNAFTLGHAAMFVNEGLPLYVVARMERRWDLSKLTVGILGMAFKAGSDDIRSSLSYKLRRILRFKAAEVLCTDPYVKVDPTLLPLEDVLTRADVIVLATPHEQYRSLPQDVPVIDIWNLLGNGVVA